MDAAAATAAAAEAAGEGAAAAGTPQADRPHAEAPPAGKPQPGKPAEPPQPGSSAQEDGMKTKRPVESGKAQPSEPAKRARRASNVPPSTLVVRTVLNFLKTQAGKGVPIEQPREVACMSRTTALEWKYGDRSAYGTFKLDKGLLPADLNEGFEQFERSYVAPTPDKLEHVLRAIHHTGEPLAVRPKVVAWRGILTKIMTTPFLSKDTYHIAMWKHKGVLYLSNRETEEKMAMDRAMTSKMKRFMYYGYKFEELATRPAEASEQARHVDPRECFCRIFKTKIGPTTVVAAGEMDCYDPVRKADIELKVSRIIEDDRQMRTFERFKLLKFYCQSFLAGVPLIVVGFRDDAGVLRKTQTLETLKIPRSLRGREDSLWRAGVCLQFLDYVLKWLDALVPECGEDVNASPVYLYTNDGTGRISVQPVPRRPDEHVEASLLL